MSIEYQRPPVRVAVIGLGRAFFTEHYPIFKAHPQLFKVVATCDLLKERRDIVAKDFPDCRMFRQIPDMLEERDIDLVDIATCSNGVRLENPKHLAKGKKKLAREQRRLSRKRRGSKNYQKQRVKVALAHERVANRRRDALHKATTAAVRESQAIAAEALRIRPMLGDSGRGRRADGRVHAAVADASMGELLRQLRYKCAWHGRPFVEVDPVGTSETCSACGHMRPMPLWRRTYRCPECGMALGRDLNAAANIAREGARLLNARGTAGHAGTGALAPTLVETGNAGASA